MPAEDVRKLLLRVLFDSDFHQKMLENPEQALVGYHLSDHEKQELTNPGKSFYALLTPAGIIALQGGVRVQMYDPPPVTTTTVTVTTTTVTVTTTTTTTTTTTSFLFNSYNFLVTEALQVLGKQIRDKGAKDQFDKILVLLNRMSGERT